MTKEMQEALQNVKRVHREHRVFNWRRKYLRIIWRREDRKYKMAIRNGNLMAIGFKIISEEI